MTEIVLGSGNNGGTVTLATGDRLRVVLTENPTTGFRWQLTPVDVAVLRLEMDDYQRAPGTGVGGGGARVFRFAAVGPGNVNLRLELKRAWELQAAREAFTTTVVVH